MSDHAILTADAHRDLRVRIARGADYGDAVMCAIVVPQEFRKVQHHYPILFRRELEQDRFNALAMFGFKEGENLFLDDERWDASYRPLSIDIQPFLIGGGPADGPKQVHVDLASPRLDREAGEPLFDEVGRPTAFLDAMTQKLGALDAGYRGAQGFFEALRRYELLSPLTLEVPLADGTVNRLVGFHGIDEGRLAALDAAALGELQAAGYLLPIFMSVASVGRWQDLIARKNRRIGNG